VGPVGRSEKCLSFQDTNSGPSVVQPVSSPYTEWAIPDPSRPEKANEINRSFRSLLKSGNFCGQLLPYASVGDLSVHCKHCSLLLLFCRDEWGALELLMSCIYSPPLVVGLTVTGKNILSERFELSGQLNGYMCRMFHKFMYRTYILYRNKYSCILGNKQHPNVLI
jgi:hypothetical protein